MSEAGAAAAVNESIVALGREYPDVIFRVVARPLLDESDNRTHLASGPGLDVSWTDGPPASHVSALLRPFAQVVLDRRASLLALGALAMTRWLAADPSTVRTADVAEFDYRSVDPAVLELTRLTMGAGDLNPETDQDLVILGDWLSVRAALARLARHVADFAPAVAAAAGLDLRDIADRA
jgi:hypothetical protein